MHIQTILDSQNHKKFHWRINNSVVHQLIKFRWQIHILIAHWSRLTLSCGIETKQLILSEPSVNTPLKIKFSQLFPPRIGLCDMSDLCAGKRISLCRLLITPGVFSLRGYIGYSRSHVTIPPRGIIEKFNCATCTKRIRCSRLRG
jgi:hypothetical protein